MGHRLTLATLSALALALSACSGGSKSESTPAQAPQPVRTVPKPVAAPKPVQTAPKPSRGASLYKRCKVCHEIKDGGRHKVGPNLYGIAGTTAGTQEGFAYSNVMKSSAIVWTDENLDAYLARPSAFMPGNRMSFVGLKKPEDRAAVIAYIKEQSGQ